MLSVHKAEKSHCQSTTCVNLQQCKLGFPVFVSHFFLYNAIGDWLLFLLCAVVRTVCLQGKKTFPEFIPPPPFFPLNFSFEFHVRAVLSTLPMLCNKLRYEAAWGELLFLQGTLPLVAFLCGWKKKKAENSIFSFPFWNWNVIFQARLQKLVTTAVCSTCILRVWRLAMASVNIKKKHPNMQRY